MSDTPELMTHERIMTGEEYVSYSDYLSLCQERDEAIERALKAERELDEAQSLARAGYARAERGEKMLRIAAAKADQWRECAEKLESFVYTPFAADEHAACAAALAEFKRLKEGGE